MSTSRRTAGGVEILDCSGAMTLTDAVPALRDWTRSALESGQTQLLLNFSEVPFVDSPTIGETVACLKRARERGGSLKLLVAPESKVAEIIRLTGLERLIDVFHDEERALASFP